MHIIPGQPPDGALEHERLAAIADPRERAVQVADVLAVLTGVVDALRSLRRSTVRELLNTPMTGTEVAELLGVSPQRVSQLAGPRGDVEAVAA
ncbi:hypothetical protein GCM10010123_45840 [Pilimelia anulata]|uniref:Uncharacterized protein n=1 Tax=Pilimelia anulata TaxID=53371 RepID=A0A8J3BD15_9ACTN|nr:hypothetical protein [Pilimelia anulata]GGK10671.1 hypothetical protein GCM10010123_45840 [Pilimelia anulata]